MSWGDGGLEEGIGRAGDEGGGGAVKVKETSSSYTFPGPSKMLGLPRCGHVVPDLERKRGKGTEMPNNPRQEGRGSALFLFTPLVMEGSPH